MPFRPSRSDLPTSADAYAAAVYGAVVAAALITAFRREHASPEATALALISTLWVFWLAHVWSAMVGQRIYDDDRGLWRHSLGPIARAEWPLVEAAFAPAILLLLGWAGLIAEDTVTGLAIAACCLELFVFGVAVGRRAYSRWRPALLSGIVDAALGLLLISLEVLVIH